MPPQLLVILTLGSRETSLPHPIPGTASDWVLKLAPATSVVLRRMADLAQLRRSIRLILTTEAAANGAVLLISLPAKRHKAKPTLRAINAPLQYFLRPVSSCILV
jgi:hypothetical protein